MESVQKTLFDCGTRLAVMCLSQSALLSCISVLFLLSYIGVSKERLILSDVTEKLQFKSFSASNRQRLFRSHLDVYFTGLLFSDLMQSLGGVMKFRWVHLSVGFYNCLKRFCRIPTSLIIRRVSSKAHIASHKAS